MDTGRKTAEQKRTVWINIRVTKTEHERLLRKVESTTCRKMSDYVRRVIFEKPVIVKTRDQSIDQLMQELIRLRKELNAVGNNFNQVVRQLHSTPHAQAVTYWASAAVALQKELVDRIGNIQKKIDELTGKWLQT